MQEILRRKQSLSLNLKRALPASPGDRSSSGDETTSSCDMKSFQDANNRKLQIASALSLLPQSVPSSIETMETFHTAAADSPDPPVVFVDADTTRTSDSAEKNEDAQEQEGESGEDDVTRDSRRSPEVESEGTTIINTDKISFTTETAATTSDEEEQKDEEEEKKKKKTSSPTVTSAIMESSILQDSLESPIQQNPAMKRLNQRIARQRMMVMRCLEANTPSKEDLNRQITILQDLQKQQIELEVSLLEDERKNQRQPPARCSDGDDRLAIASVGNVDYVQNEPNAYCSVESTNNSSAILLTVATTRSQLFRNNRPNTNDQETLSETTPPRRSSSRGYSTVYLTVSSSRLFLLFHSLSLCFVAAFSIYNIRRINY